MTIEQVLLISLIVSIIDTIMLGTLLMIIMAIYKETSIRADATSEKVDRVRESLEVSSTTLAQESTLKNLEGKTIVIGSKVDDLNTRANENIHHDA